MTILQPPQSCSKIYPTTRADLLARLDTAVESAQAAAILDGKNGVLITRHDHSTFSVEISPEVPYGLTIERDALRQS